MAEADEALNCVLLALEGGLDAPVAVVAHPARDTRCLRSPPHAVAEEHALNEPVDDDAPADHGRRTIPSGSTSTGTGAPGAGGSRGGAAAPSSPPAAQRTR